MANVRWKNFDTMEDLRRNDVLNMLDMLSNRTESTTEKREHLYNPRIDTIETIENFVINAELPDMKKEKIKINVSDNILTIRGEKKTPEDEWESMHYSERVFGKFERSFSLPAKIDVAKIKADYKNGVLSVILPKKEKMKPRDIPISVA